MIYLAETAQSSANVATPWIWLAGSVAAYIGFLALNPLGSCIGAAYKLVRTRPILWLLPVVFGLSAAAMHLLTYVPVEDQSADTGLDDLARQALFEAWELLPFFPHMLITTPFPLSVLAAVLFLSNVGGVLVGFARSGAWSSRGFWVIGFGFAVISAFAHVLVGGAQVLQLEWQTPVVFFVLSQMFTLLTAMFVQAYLIAAIILASSKKARRAKGKGANADSALMRAAECFPRIVPLVVLYTVVWGLKTYGGNSGLGSFANNFIVPEILLILAFLPASALVVKSGFAAVGGVALGALLRSWWVWLWGLIAIFLTLFLLRFAAGGLAAAWPVASVEGTVWLFIYPLLWGALATWMLAAWVIAFREYVLPAAGARARPKRKTKKPKKRSARKKARK